MTYPLLSDADSQVIRRFGILNNNMPEGDPLYGVPFPGFYLLDSAGRVRAKSFLVDHTTRTTAASMLMEQQDTVPDNGRIEIDTQDVRLTLQQSSKVARPGQTLSIRAELEVNPGLHIYGPEVPESYLPTTLNLNDAEVLLQHKFHFPEPQLLHIEAVNETVPMYTGKIVIEGNLILKPFVSPGQYQLPGMLRYQACTDSECYFPEEISFELPLQVEPTIAQVKE